MTQHNASTQTIHVPLCFAKGHKGVGNVAMAAFVGRSACSLQSMEHTSFFAELVLDCLRTRGTTVRTAQKQCVSV